MEINRNELSNRLKEIMTDCGETPNLYFQPPETVKLVYPCIIYRLSTSVNRYADNVPYSTSIAYDVTYITRSPTSSVPTCLMKEPLFRFSRYYTAENLHHYAYTASSALKEVSND